MCVEKKLLTDDLRQNLLADLLSGAAEIGLELAPKRAEMLLDYLGLLVEWNKIHNLVAPCSPEVMLSRHFLDSLAVLPVLLGCAEILGRVPKKIIDLGTGAGFPGLVLAIVAPEINFILLDSNLKKINFVQVVISTLRLANAVAVRSRSESYHPQPKADMVIARAVSSIPTFLEFSRHLCYKDGLFVAMKGKIATALQEGVPKGFQLVNIQEIKVPSLIGERSLVILKQH